MRKKLFSLLLAVVLLSTLGGTAFADLPGGGWATNTQVQNVGTETAQINVTSYGAGGPFNSATKDAVVGGSVTFLATELGLPATFSGAGVIASTQPAFAILFVTNYGSGAGNTGSAIVRGIGQDSVATQLNYPLAKVNWGSGQKTTTFYIQNAGTVATNATVTVSVISGPACTDNNKVFAIQPNEQINFNPTNMGCAGPMFGSLTVVSDDQPLAGIVLEHDDSLASPAGGSRVLQGTTGFAPNDGDAQLIAPIIKRGWGTNQNVTGLQIQNVGTTAIPVGGLTVTYNVIGGPDAGQTKTESNTAEIPVGAAFNSLHTVLTTGSLASAIVDAPGQQIVGIVNENRPAGNPQPRTTTYSMLAAESAATSVSLPLVKEYFGAAGGRCTGVQVTAVGGSAVMELTYKATSGETFVVTTDAAAASKTFLRLSDSFTSGVTVTGGAAAAMRGKNFGVTAKSLTPGVTLVAVANESFCPNSTRDEDDANYEAFPLP